MSPILVLGLQKRVLEYVPVLTGPAVGSPASKKRHVAKDLCQKMVDQTKDEPKCLYYGFSFEGNTAHCREGYSDAEGLLDHLERIGPLLPEALQISDLTRLEVHGPEQELSRLRQPLAALNPQFFVLECGFRT